MAEAKEKSDLIPEFMDKPVGDWKKILKSLREPVEESLIRTRDGWKDNAGHTQQVSFIEWHTVADILDERAPGWQHTIKEVKEVGEEGLLVVVAIGINGVWREGIGTGSTGDGMGIKKAEHDALKRAAVKFGIARDLYKKEDEQHEGSPEGASSRRNGSESPEKPANPIASSLGDLITAKQLGMVRALSREAGVNGDEECTAVFNCKTDELSKRAASFLITHLQRLPQEMAAKCVPEVQIGADRPAADAATAANRAESPNGPGPVENTAKYRSMMDKKMSDAQHKLLSDRFQVRELSFDAWVVEVTANFWTELSMASAGYILDYTDECIAQNHVVVEF